MAIGSKIWCKIKPTQNESEIIQNSTLNSESEFRIRVMSLKRGAGANVSLVHNAHMPKVLSTGIRHGLKSSH